MKIVNWRKGSRLVEVELSVKEVEKLSEDFDNINIDCKLPVYKIIKTSHKVNKKDLTV